MNMSLCRNFKSIESEKQTSFCRMMVKREGGGNLSKPWGKGSGNLFICKMLEGEPAQEDTVIYYMVVKIS